MLVPKLFTVLKHYTKEQFVKDVIAGVIVGIIAIPLSIALAIASGVSPEKGLYTAIVGGFLISFLGGSRVQVGGPTGAFVIIVYGIIEQYGLDGLIAATILAGVFLIIMGLFRFGSMIKYIPYPITTGFTSGIALVIFSTQIKDLLGLNIQEVPSEFIDKWRAYFAHLNTIHWESAAIGALSIAVIVLWPKLSKKIPGSLVAIAAATLLTLVFHLDVQTIGSRYSEISSSFPRPHLPSFSWEMIKELIPPAVTIALLSGIESLLSAVVADGMIGGRHRSNMELVAQGAANIGSALFGGIPVTGAIARTAANIKNGGRTPVAGIVHSLVLLVTMVMFMPYAKLIPLPTLAAILVVVAYNMSEWRAFKSLLRAPKSDIVVLLVTFLLTVLIDLVAAIEVGVVLAAFLFMKRMADVTHVKSIADELMEKDRNQENSSLSDPLQVEGKVLVYEINGPFFFGAASKFIEVMDQVQKPSQVLILRMRNVPVMDATAYHALKKLYDRCRHHGTELLLSHVQIQPMAVLRKYGFIDLLGEDHLCANIDEALWMADRVLQRDWTEPRTAAAI